MVSYHGAVDVLECWRISGGIASVMWSFSKVFRHAYFSSFFNGFFFYANSRLVIFSSWLLSMSTTHTSPSISAIFFSKFKGILHWWLPRFAIILLLFIASNSTVEVQNWITFWSSPISFFIAEANCGGARAAIFPFRGNLLFKSNCLHCYVVPILF